MGSILLQALYQAPKDSLAELCSTLAQIHNEPRQDTRLYPTTLIEYLQRCSLFPEQRMPEMQISPVTAIQVLSRTNPSISRYDLRDLAEQRYAQEGESYRFSIQLIPLLSRERISDNYKTMLIEFSYNRGHSLELLCFSEDLKKASTPEEQDKLIRRLEQNQQQMASYTLALFQDVFFPSDKQHELLPPTTITIRGWNIHQIEGNQHLLENIPPLQYKPSIE